MMRTGDMTADRFKRLFAMPFDEVGWLLATSSQLHLRIGNDPPVLGREAGLLAMKYLADRVIDSGVRFCACWKRREAIFAETEVLFKDARHASRMIPCAMIARTDGTAVLDLRLYLDLSPMRQ